MSPEEEEVTKQIRTNFLSLTMLIISNIDGGQFLPAESKLRFALSHWPLCAIRFEHRGRCRDCPGAICTVTGSQAAKLAMLSFAFPTCARCTPPAIMAKFVLTSSVNPQKKRGLTASSSIYSGETILEEQPFLCSQYLWNAEYKYDACEFCLKPLETAQENVRRLTGDESITLPHTEQCCPTNKAAQVACSCQTRYCCEECRVQSFQLYHKCLCPSQSPQVGPAIRKLSDFWKSIHYPPETASIMLVVKILAAIKQAANPLEIINKINNEFVRSVEGSEEEMIHKLLGDKFKEHIVIIRDMVGQIVFDSTLEQFFAERQFLLLLSLLSRHSQGIGTSAFSKWAENCEHLVANNAAECARINQLIETLFQKMDDLSGPFLNCEGSGLYTLSSQINHSCVPNAEIRFPYNNNRLVVKAIDSINSGDEITICYLDECMQSRSRHSRVKYLKENYFFTCKCRKCESQINDPDVTSDEEESTDEDKFSDDDMNCE